MSGDKWAEDYRPVVERIEAFYADHPNGSLQSQIWEYTDTRVTVLATAYRDPDDKRPGTGHASEEIPGTTPFTKHSELENAETSAWGRALESLGYGKGASREEMAGKAQPAQESEASPAPAPKPRTAEETALLDELLALAPESAQRTLLANAVGIPQGTRANAGELRAMIEIARKPSFPPTAWPEPGTAAWKALSDYERGTALAWHKKRRDALSEE